MNSITELISQAVQFHQRGNFPQAEALYRQALQAEPNQPHALHFLGILAHQTGNQEAAIQLIQHALNIRPDLVEAHYNLGNAFRAHGKLNEAAACYRKALRLKPDLAEAHGNLGCALTELGEFGEAVASLRQAVLLQPQSAEAHGNLGSALAFQGHLEEAAECYRQALRLNPNHAVAHRDLGIYWLLKGDYQRGWPEHEWRLHCRAGQPRTFAQPRWDGSPLLGRVILVHAEQGLGDTLQFIRYIPLVKQAGGKVILECQPALLPLLQNFPGIDILVAQDTPLPDFDVHAPLLSLPGIMGTTLDTIPPNVPYLTADPKLVERWRSTVAIGSGLNIGIAWQGNPQYRGDKSRSIPLDCFEILAQVPGVHLVSLQKGEAGTRQLAALGGRFPILDLSDRLATFSDTAAVMMNLDLIISSCTSVPHLAGALGRPVWTVLHFIPDWRWLLDRADSPWYPTMRLFRQKKPGAWGDVFERIAVEIRRLAV